MPENQRMMRDFHLYTHAGCLDGSAAALLFRHAGGLKQNIRWVQAGRTDELMKESKAVLESNTPLLLVDISPTTIDFANYLATRGNVWIIDHHSTATYLNGMHQNFSVDERACGSENFRKWLVDQSRGADEFRKFVDEPFKRLTRLIDDHDRWQLKIPFALEVSKFFAFVGQKDFIERFMNIEERFSDEKESYWTPFEEDLMKLLRRIQERRYRAAFEKMQIVKRDFFGRQLNAAYIISDEVNNSEMLMQYLHEHPEIDLAIQISFGLQKVSLRSDNRVDVSEIAVKYGGGGHRNAAAHPLPRGMIAGIIGGIHGAGS